MVIEKANHRREEHMENYTEALLAPETQREAGQLLTQIHELQFAAVELQLYLDTHPEDLGALAMFNQYHTDLIRCIREYEARCGPLLNYGLSASPRHRWGWLEGPWPWEMNY
jgi:spore coat protein JB